jgi:hypothetical protein
VAGPVFKSQSAHGNFNLIFTSKCMTGEDDVQGHFLGMPYDFRKPSFEKIKKRFWNSEDRRILTPMVFGWGYAFNLYELGRSLKIVR